jgi:hypothetical protein
MIPLIFLLLITCASAETFKIAGSFVTFSSRGSLLLKGCEKDCQALKVIAKHTKIDLAATRQGMEFVNSIGSDVCSKVYHMRSVLGVAENHDGRAFCLFEDNSMVEMTSLTRHLVKKKYLKQY